MMYISLAVSVFLGTGFLMSNSVQAQTTLPALAVSEPRHPRIKPTSIEAVVNLGYEASRTASRVTSPIKSHYPKDSLRVVTQRRAQAWLDILQRTPVKGLQLDSYGIISVVAKQDELAQQQIAARLATLELPVSDKAYTLQIAVSSFASLDYPERLPIAERYLAQLDALGAEAAFWQMEARKPLMSVYYLMGRSDDVVRVGVKAFSLVDKIPFEWRENAVYYPGIAFEYAALVDALGGKPNGREKIREMNRQLLDGSKAPQAYVAQDSFFLYIAEQYYREIKWQVAMSERAGQQGTPLVSNYWVNRGVSRDSQTVAVNDGKIRVLEIGSFTCPPCMAAIPGMQRLYQRYPSVEFNFMTHGEGTWGNRVVEPKVEAGYLADHFTKKLGVTFPIGIAMASKLVPTEDGGESMEISTPTWQENNYPQSAKPTFYILDGKGIIRRVIGGYFRDLEDNIAATLEFLQAEARQSQ